MLIPKFTNLLQITSRNTRHQVLENDTNKHCEPFIDFLLGAKLCIINGRVQGKNDFTYITPKGKSVVDYCLTFIDNLHYIKSCDVLRVKEILDSISHTPTCAIPDHSVISINIQINEYEFWKKSVSYSDNLTKQNQFPYRKKYNFNVIP